MSGKSSFQPEFAFTARQTRVRFGPGVRRSAAEEIERLGAERAVLLSTPRQEARVRQLAGEIGGAVAGIVAHARMHTPVEVTAQALAEVRRLDGDCLIAFGGGSAIGLGKALAHLTGLPQIALPTTYAGSEATPVLGQTKDGRKSTMTDAKIQPEVILYDAELVRSLPANVSVASALNAMAHAAEGLYARDRNPVSTLLAIEGIRAFAHALPVVHADPSDLSARGETLYGAWLCGTVLGQVGMALHHKLCHVLGGAFDLPHAQTHAVLLPYTLAYNAEVAGGELQPIAEILANGSNGPGAAVAAFAEALGAPRSLREIGLKERDLAQSTDLAMQDSYWNPRKLDRDEISRMLRSAWAGEAL